MRKFIAILGVVALMGCASTPESSTDMVEPVAISTVETPASSLQDEVLTCVTQLMEQEAHVMDATKACGYIYGLDDKREARTAQF